MSVHEETSVSACKVLQSITNNHTSAAGIAHYSRGHQDKATASHCVIPHQVSNMNSFGMTAVIHRIMASGRIQTA